MYKQRPLGIKIVFSATLLSGILGVFLYLLSFTPFDIHYILETVISNQLLVIIAVIMLLSLIPAMLIVIPVLLLLSSVWGSYNLLFKNIMGFLEQAMGNIAVSRSYLLLFACFNLWLGHIIFQLKRIAWFMLLVIFVLTLGGLIASLAVINIRELSLADTDKILLLALTIIDLLWIFYLVTIKPYFVY